MTNPPQSAIGIDLATAAELAAQLRVDSIRYTTSADSGHPTSSMSAADILAVLAGRHLRYDWDNPGNNRNDHLIFSKGHASPLLYAVYRAVGVVSDEELLTSYRRFGSRLEGHPTPALPWVDVATGSLGQGLPDGAGIALAGKWDMTASDGSSGQPTVVLARTVKGRGFAEVEDKNGWPGRAFPAEMADRAIAELGGLRNLTVRGPRPDEAPHAPLPVPGTPGLPGAPVSQAVLMPQGPVPRRQIAWPAYALGEKVATRKAYGDALAALGAMDHCPEGGVGSVVLEALAGTGQGQPLRVAHLAVRDMAGPGAGAPLLAAAGAGAGRAESAARGLPGIW